LAPLSGQYTIHSDRTPANFRSDANLARLKSIGADESGLKEIELPTPCVWRGPLSASNRAPADFEKLILSMDLRPDGPSVLGTDWEVKWRGDKTLLRAC
jgi:hypothetical protein